jgi:hypothetical protein
LIFGRNEIEMIPRPLESPQTTPPEPVVEVEPAIHIGD